MPETAPIAKVSATKGYGAEVVLRVVQYMMMLLQKLWNSKATGAVFTSIWWWVCNSRTRNYWDRNIRRYGRYRYSISTNWGGGILAGIATAIKGMNPKVKVIGVEAENAASMTAALAKGECCEVCATPTIADGIAVKK